MEITSQFSASCKDLTITQEGWTSKTAKKMFKGLRCTVMTLIPI
jgi:hypothetical protein